MELFGEPGLVYRPGSVSCGSVWASLALCCAVPTDSTHSSFCWKPVLIYSVSYIFISNGAPNVSSFFHGNHFILCTQSGLLAAANIFLIKAVLIGWALAGGRKARLMTEKSDKWTTNTLQFKEGRCHRGQREAGGDAPSQWVCYTSAVWCCQGKMLGFKRGGVSRRDQRHDLLLES